MKKIFSRSATVLLLSFALTGALGAHYSHALASSLSVWWPTDNVQVAGVQPFKAVMDGMPLSDYSMYWQVDNGQLNPMSDNMTDSPHKEASVDVSNWHWQSNGTYQVNFVAKDKNGNTIGNKNVTIHANSANQTVNVAPATVTTAPSAAPASPSNASAPVAPAPASRSISIWWPTDGSSMTGVQPFKALVDNMPLSNYSMYWQVDNGQLNPMSDNFNGGGHKEASVNLTNWNWKGSGPYAITIVAKDASGNTIASKTVNIKLSSSGSPTPANPPASNPTPSNGSGSTPVVTTPPPTTTPPVVTVPPTTAPADPTSTPSAPNTGSFSPVSTGPARSGDPLSGISLFVDPTSESAVQAQAWATSQPANAALMMKIASEPVGKWFGGWNSNIQADTAAFVNAAASSNSVPTLIAYNIPFRDCGGFSAGGATTPDAYNAWIKGMAQGIGSNKAIVILEPDGLANMDCLSQSDQTARFAMLQNAVTTLKANKNTSVYIDAGNSNWISAADMAPRLEKAGIASADGFALNVSNFYANSDLLKFGDSLSSLVGGKHFVVDTSRNGLGPDGSNWCNPSGRALGVRPTSETGDPLADAFLWLKTPGESDGNCNGGPSAGVWWPDYAIGLSQRAAY